MKTTLIYTCEKCGREFESGRECFNHEQQCGAIKTFTCDKCGKVIKYDENSNYNQPNWNINLGRAGYESRLDGSDIDFNLCDECLEELIESFTWEGRAKVNNSGSNTYGSSEDWIKLHKNEMSDEEKIEKGYRLEEIYNV